MQVRFLISISLFSKIGKKTKRNTLSRITRGARYIIPIRTQRGVHRCCTDYTTWNRRMSGWKNARRKLHYGSEKSVRVQRREYSKLGATEEGRTSPGEICRGMHQPACRGALPRVYLWPFRITFSGAMQRISVQHSPCRAKSPRKKVPSHWQRAQPAKTLRQKRAREHKLSYFFTLLPSLTLSVHGYYFDLHFSSFHTFIRYRYSAFLLSGIELQQYFYHFMY